MTERSAPGALRLTPCVDRMAWPTKKVMKLATTPMARTKSGKITPLCPKLAMPKIMAATIRVRSNVNGVIQRSTFLAGPDGTIANVWPRVSVEGHAAAVLEAVRSL